MAEILKVDAMGDTCPIPVVKTKKVLDTAKAGTVVEVHVDNEIAVQNLTKLARSQQCESKAETVDKKHFIVRITVAEKPGKPGESGSQAEPGSQADSGSQADPETPPACRPDARDQSVVVISSSVMGTGNDELGKVLMKGFIYALSQLDTLPDKILFYNGGVTWTTEGSDALEDLKAMEAQGVQILSCGTCLNYYGLSEKLMVGEVTNMYNIVEAMAAASKIIRP